MNWKHLSGSWRRAQEAPAAWSSVLLRYGSALACTAAALLLRLALDPVLNDHYVFPTFIFAIIVVNWLCGLGPAVMTIILSLVLTDWFLIPPRHAFLRFSPDRWIAFVTFVLVSSVIVWYRWTNRRAQARLDAEVRERVQAGERAMQSERRLAMVAAATFEGVAISQDGRFVDANDQLAALLGYTREELLGKAVEEVVAPEDRPGVMKAIQAGIEVRREVTLVRKDGFCFIAEAHGKTAQFGQRCVRFTAIRDITERKAVENALRESKEQIAGYNLVLERAVVERTARLQETVAELHHFSYALAHDMRAPLRAINGFLTLIEGQIGQAFTPPTREWFGRVRLATEHMDHFITDALNYNKAVLNELPLERLDLQALVAGLVETLPHLHPGNTQISIGSKLPAVLGNRTALVQCFSNLFDNAIKFSKPGTTPRIVVWAEDRAHPGAPAATVVPPREPPAHDPNRFSPPSFKLGASLRDPLAQFVRIWVEDNGIGIPKDSHSRLFSMFGRLTTSCEGTGIGLAIVRKVVQRMGGEVGVESEEGRGSRFWFEVRRA